jgi:hypothetical protein
MPTSDSLYTTRPPIFRYRGPSWDPTPALECSVADLPAGRQFFLIHTYFVHFHLLLRNSLRSQENECVRIKPIQVGMLRARRLCLKQAARAQIGAPHRKHVDPFAAARCPSEWGRTLFSRFQGFSWRLDSIRNAKTAELRSESFPPPPYLSFSFQ